MKQQLYLLSVACLFSLTTMYGAKEKGDLQRKLFGHAGQCNDKIVLNLLRQGAEIKTFNKKTPINYIGSQSFWNIPKGIQSNCLQTVKTLLAFGDTFDQDSKNEIKKTRLMCQSNTFMASVNEEQKYRKKQKCAFIEKLYDIADSQS